LKFVALFINCFPANSSDKRASDTTFRLIFLSHSWIQQNFSSGFTTMSIHADIVCVRVARYVIHQIAYRARSSRSKSQNMIKAVIHKKT